MNFRIIAYIVGWVCNFQAAFMMLPLLTAGIYREKDFSAFLLAMLMCLVVGVPLTRKKPKNKVFYIKDGCVAVALSWLALCIFGAIPFVASGCIPHPICLRLFPDLQRPVPVSFQMWKSFLIVF